MRAPDVAPDVAGRLLDEPWAALVDALEVISPATTPIAQDEPDVLAWKMADLVEDWLKHVGFTITHTDEGMYFAVLRHDFVPPFDESEPEPVPET